MSRLRWIAALVSSWFMGTALDQGSAPRSRFGAARRAALGRVPLATATRDVLAAAVRRARLVSRCGDGCLPRAEPVEGGGDGRPAPGCILEATRARLVVHFAPGAVRVPVVRRWRLAELDDPFADRGDDRLARPYLGVRAVLLRPARTATLARRATAPAAGLRAAVDARSRVDVAATAVLAAPLASPATTRRLFYRLAAAPARRTDLRRGAHGSTADAATLPASVIL
jgi:hypothetical protein